MNGLIEGKAALEELRQFIGKSQLAALRELFTGEERQYFFDKACELRDLVANMPKTWHGPVATCSRGRGELAGLEASR
jgi:hypothetical protein